LSTKAGPKNGFSLTCDSNTTLKKNTARFVTELSLHLNSYEHWW